MERNESESKPGLYDVYYTDGGKKLLVLEGLNPNDQFEAPVLQQKIHEHYDLIVVFYWVLLAATLSYVIYANIVKPLLKGTS